MYEMYRMVLLLMPLFDQVVGWAGMGSLGCLYALNYAGLCMVYEPKGYKQILRDYGIVILIGAVGGGALGYIDYLMLH